MSRTEKAVAALCIFNVLVWSYFAVGLMAWELQSGELYARGLAEGMRRAREQGLRVEPLDRTVLHEIFTRYGITNSGVVLNVDEAETLSGFLEAARRPGIVYVSGSGLYAFGREDLIAYAPVIRGRLWPYTVEWVNR